MKWNTIYSPILHDRLIKCSLENDDSKDMTYLTTIRVLKKGGNTVVYNYISYPDIFTPSLLYFLISKENFGNTNLFKEWGDYLTLLDSHIGKDSKYSEELDLYKKGFQYHNCHYNEFRNSFHYPNQMNNLQVFFDVLKKLVLVEDTKYIYECLVEIINKDYISICKKIAPEIDTSKFKINDIYLLKDCLFVVRDLNGLITKLNESGYTVNKGPKGSRDQLSSSISFLSCLDLEYRQFLYNYHMSLVSDQLMPSTRKLPRSRFSFKNVHQNLGNVRWYSTQRSVSSDSPKNNRQKLFEINYNIISDILDKNYNVGSVKIQEEIEKLLYRQEKLLFNGNVLDNRLNFNNKSYDFINTKYNQLCKLLNYPDDLNISKTSYSTEYISLFNMIIKELGVELVSNMLLSYYMEILTKETITLEDKESPGIATLTAFNSFGKKIFDRYIYNLYIKSDIYTNKGTLSQFKLHMRTEFPEIYNEDSSYAKLGGYFVHNLVAVKLLDQVIDKNPEDSTETVFYLRITIESRNIFITNNFKIYHIPQKLPMVCEPKDFVYSKHDEHKKLGGYLFNDIYFTTDLIKDRIGYGEQTRLNDENMIVSLVNGLNKTPYKINTDTLEFVYKYGIEKKIIIDDTTKDIQSFKKNPYKGYTKKEGNKYRSIVSKITMERNILSIAETFSKLDKIYFPVILDFRTRIYTQTDYFDYQKNDLAKGLISFANPGIINKYDNEIFKYFKAYGANMYGYNLDKKSLNYRVKWIDDNMKTILNFEFNDIVDKAENKACFISFCFEYKRFVKFMQDNDSTIFQTYLPIQLDATCNGYQHLALLTKETKILSKLNLDMSSHDDDPNDYYSYVWDNTKKYIISEIDKLSKQTRLSDKESKELTSLKKLQEIELGRSILKKVLMRESYSAGLPKLVDNVLNDELVTELKPDTYKYRNSDVTFNRYDIAIYVKSLKRVSALVAPKINELSKYLDNIVIICTKLGMYIPWGTPSGANISESYLVEKERKIAAFSFTKSKYTFKKYVKGVYDLKKQKRAIRPNLIHSLDATTIALLYNNLHNIDLYTVHDCFAVTANNVPMLIYKLKMVYIRLYSEEGYLLKFDKALRMNISIAHGEKIGFNVDDKYINIPNSNRYKRVLFPDVSKVVDLNSNHINNVSKSSYPII